jgi:hypothetical protein
MRDKSLEQSVDDSVFNMHRLNGSDFMHFSLLMKEDKAIANIIWLNVLQPIRSRVCLSVRDSVTQCVFLKIKLINKSH